MKTLEHSQVINTLGRENIFGHNPIIGARQTMCSMPWLSCYMVVTRCPRTVVEVLTTRRDSGLDGSPKSGLMRFSMRSSGP